MGWSVGFVWSVLERSVRIAERAVCVRDHGVPMTASMILARAKAVTRDSRAFCSHLALVFAPGAEPETFVGGFAAPCRVRP